MAHFITIGFVLIAGILAVNCVDLDYTEITIVTDDTRYRTLHPDTPLDTFDKIRHVKGNIYFSKGKRITGDQLLLNFLDSESFTRAEDIEVWLRYPAEGYGKTITFIEVLVDLTSEAEADTFAIAGGVGKNFAEFLIECNDTINFTYELFLYGY